MVTIPGFNILTNSNNPLWLKSVWAVIILSVSSTALKQIWERGAAFFLHTTSLRYEFPPETYISFPQVTICPWEPFAGKNLSQTDLEDTWNNGGPDFYKELSDCRWKTINCSEPQFWTQVSTMLGRCYTLSFKSLKEKYTTSAVNIEASIEITILEESFRNRSGTNDSSSVSKPTSHSGVYAKWGIHVHDSDADVTYETLIKGLPLIRRVFQKVYYYKRVYHRIDPCTSAELRNECHLKCMDRELLQNETCRMPFMKTVDLPLCTNEHKINKLYPTPIQNYRRPLDVQCQCERTCHSVVYNIVKDVEAKTEKNLTGKTYVGLRPLHKRPNTLTIYERCEYTFNNLICDVGATLGLFLGVSLLTICEIIEYVILSLRARVRLTTRPKSDLKICARVK